MKTPKTTFSIRLTELQHQQLQDLALNTGQDISSLIRIAVDALIAHYEACGLRLILPLDFSEIIRTISTIDQPHDRFNLRLNEDPPVTKRASSK